ncbi:mechanosensitive ion channel [Alphaproteobacteria bacterium GH1-50]|uniref:Small-conductance mechanosensitive channel n=1 Tax=Kangsaoukella pontilimi TaxID=2691042 RepID=A0A7C9MG48_9RHOB|nr:mechanosensitive ion channel domain-containing protein [Kangsaoukella pontilimi]MXQ08116.1 mechanosensitive ion channel [Kangsaoukella pontilimi]
MRIGQVLRLMALLMFAAGFCTSLSAQDAAGPEGAIEVGETAISDTQIADRINAVLAEIEGFDSITVAVSAGVVRLQGEVLDQVAEAELVRIVERVEGVVAIDNELTQTTDLNERLAPAVERLVDRVDRLFANAPIFGVALAALAAISVLGWLLTTRLTFWQRLAPNRFIADIYRAVARIAFVLLGVIVALDILNATALIGAVLGAAGVVGLAVGFAVRDTVENFIASILLSLRQPFRPNDVVEIDGETGSVARLTSRATILISPDGNHIRIPNSTVFKGKIVNFTRDPQRRFVFKLGVDADADLTAALAVSVEALEGLDFILSEPPIGAWVDEVGDSNVVLSFAAWVDQTQTNFLKARGEAIRVTKTALESSGFGLPEPIYRLKFDGRPATLLESDSAAPAKPDAPQPQPVSKPLPEAAAPQQTDRTAEEAVDREQERQKSDAGRNLLTENSAQE